MPCCANHPLHTHHTHISNSQDTYQAVKQASDSECGVPTQCFVAQKAGVGRSSPPPKGRLQVGQWLDSMHDVFGTPFICAHLGIFGGGSSSPPSKGRLQVAQCIVCVALL